jgi:tetratricopeptide (TPR) repeat protein
LTSSASATWRIAAERAAAALLVGWTALAGASPAAAQEAASQSEFELGRSVQRSLARVQESWLQWVGASLQDSDARADEALRSLSIAVREIGFQHLPDLAMAAVAQARQSTREGNWNRAERQLAAAATLDPGNPEIAFGRAALSRARGDWSGAARAWTGGVWATLTGRPAAKARASALLWVLTVLAVSCGLFVALLAWRHGRAAVAALQGLLSPPLPSWAAAGVVAFLAFAPLALPSGLTWLLWLWSILLWSFASRSERIVLAAGWLLLAVAPAIADRSARRLALDQTPPMRAWQAFESGRLYGGFFSDVQVLRAALPEHPAALEFAADLHRTLGQWDIARGLYRRALLAEPQNVPVLLNLGAYSFRKGEFALANAYFQRATEAPVPSAAAWFNLSLGFSESYLFDDSRAALGRAREIDGAAVDVWMATPNPDRVLTFNASLTRRDEVRSALLAAWTRPAGGRLAGLPPGLVGAVAALLAAALAAGFHAAHDLPAAARREAPGAGGALRRWAETLLPALGATRRGAGALAWSNLALLVAIALLPRMFEMAGDLPVPSWPGPRLLAVVATAAALVYVALCARLGVQAREE